MRPHTFLIAGLVLAAMASGCALADSPQLEHRWLFVMRNLAEEENVEGTLALLPRAKAAGYTAIVLSDGNLYRLGSAGVSYRENVRRLQAEARGLGLDLIPCVMPIGYSGAILGDDPNLAEGLPVKDSLFVVHGREAVHVPDPEVELPGGDFEDAEEDRFAGWDWQDNAGESIFADHEVVHGGGTSVRMENIGQADPVHGHCRFMRTVKVAPFRQYRISVCVKTEGFETPDRARIAVLAPTERERSVSFAEFGVERTQDWKEYHAVFNSLGWNEVRFYFGTWGGKAGRIWWDDIVLEEVGLVNVLRREGCPVTVRGEDGTAYEEGVDYEVIRDPEFSLYGVGHRSATIKLTGDSRMREGMRLRVSYYHPVIIGRWQVMCCLSEPKVYEILREQVRQVNDLLHPSAFFMQHDEIRVGNWDDACQKRGLTPGGILADNVHRCVAIIRDINPDARIWVWSDMFDPMHNAVDEYYLVNGTWAGSWEGLPAEVGIVNWAGHLEGKNLKWFADRGHEQVLAGYYDGDRDGAGIRAWLKAGEGLPSIVGAMYTTWQDEYDYMEAWGAQAWGSGEARE